MVTPVRLAWCGRTAGKSVVAFAPRSAAKGPAKVCNVFDRPIRISAPARSCALARPKRHAAKAHLPSRLYLSRKAKFMEDIRSSARGCVFLTEVGKHGPPRLREGLPLVDVGEGRDCDHLAPIEADERASS
jgi:hypothetical protein